MFSLLLLTDFNSKSLFKNFLTKVCVKSGTLNSGCFSSNSLSSTGVYDTVGYNIGLCDTGLSEFLYK